MSLVGRVAGSSSGQLVVEGQRHVSVRPENIGELILKNLKLSSFVYTSVSAVHTAAI